jgi:DNA-binding transcriptional ArsR family regulator
VCKHLRVLERAGLVRRRREAQSRPCELDPAPLKEIAAWTDAYREFWDASFDRLGAYLNQLQQPTGGRHARRRKR